MIRIVLLALLVTYAAAQEAREVPVRTIPVPTTVSPQLQRIIAAPPRVLSDPKTEAEWRAMMTMATVLKLKELGVALPGALFIGTLWSDLTKTGDTYFANERVDNSLVTYDGFLEDAAKLYAGTRSLREPLLSPLYGDLHGFPPSILFSGTRDLFLSLTVRMHRRLRQAGVEAALHVRRFPCAGDSGSIW